MSPGFNEHFFRIPSLSPFESIALDKCRHLSISKAAVKGEGGPGIRQKDVKVNLVKKLWAF